MVDEKLLKILVCPGCRSKLRHVDEKLECTGCGKRFPIRDGIPIMLLSEAEDPNAPGSSGTDAAG